MKNILFELIQESFHIKLEMHSFFHPFAPYSGSLWQEWKLLTVENSANLLFVYKAFLKNNNRFAIQTHFQVLRANSVYTRKNRKNC